MDAHREIAERLALTEKRIERMTFLASCAVGPAKREAALATLEEERRRWIALNATGRRDGQGGAAGGTAGRAASGVCGFVDFFPPFTIVRVKLLMSSNPAVCFEPKSRSRKSPAEAGMA
ncbi:MAG TPA: hypothetical protein VMU47_00780 [Caldimonas sp.]|nr:hypothetical protein [Caldimonas sp.]